MLANAQFLLALGGILVLGLITDWVGKKTFLPRITLLLIFGIIIGEEGFNLIPTVFSDRFELIAEMTLLVVGFMLGGILTTETIKKSGKTILSISISAAVFTTAIVTLALSTTGLPLEIAILLGCIASATAPAATVDTVIESNNKSNFSRSLLAIVALDDAWGLILFSLGIALVAVINGNPNETHFILSAGFEIGGAVLLGLGIGLPAAFLTGRIKPGRPMLTEALAVVFVCGGLALWLDVSFLIAAMTLGAPSANLAKHHEYPLNAIEGIEWPLMIIFFILAGASLNIASLNEIGMIIIVFIIFRGIGKIIGANIGARISNADKTTRHWMGAALLPQAGAAMGMALVASNQFPEYRQTLLSVVISSTIFFEIIGPVFTRIALKKAARNE